jgi:hypothetical protein
VVAVRRVGAWTAMHKHRLRSREDGRTMVPVLLRTCYLELRRGPRYSNRAGGTRIRVGPVIRLPVTVVAVAASAAGRR